jgi:glycosyltransferase involved in cell wall biosynthesis
MMPLRILFLLSDIKDSATYVRALNLSKQMATLGHDLTLMVVSSEQAFSTVTYLKFGIRIIETPNFMHNGLGHFTRRLFLDPGTGPLDIHARLKEIKSGYYDIIQLFDHSLNVFIPWMLIRNRFKGKFVSDWCDIFNYEGGLRYAYCFRLDKLYRMVGYPFRKISQYLEFNLRRGVDGVTAISDGLREFAIRHGVAKDNIFVVEGGADVDAIKPIPKKDARRRLGLPVTSSIVGFLGTFQGDLEIVIRSFTKVKREIPDSLLLVIGKPSPWIKSAVAEAGIASSYIEAGRCSDEMLPHFLACVDVLTLPLGQNLASETRWPNRIGEYMACGRPIVVSNIGDTAKVVRNNAIGLVAGPEIDGFADTIITLLQDGQLAHEMGCRARELACTRYSWALQAAKLEEIYFHLLASPHSTRR